MLHLLFQVVVGLVLMAGGLVGLSFVVGPVIIGRRRSRDRRVACDPVDCATLGCPDGEAFEVRRETPVPFVWSPPVAETSAVVVNPFLCVSRPRRRCAWCGLVMDAGNSHVVSDGICDDCLRTQLDDLGLHHEAEDQGDA